MSNAIIGLFISVTCLVVVVIIQEIEFWRLRR